MKICASCGLEKPLNAFFKDVSRKDGHGPYCKSCDTKRSCRWQATHLAQHNVNSKRWCERHPERRKAVTKRYRKKHPKQIKATNVRDYIEHREQRVATHARYRKKHPEQDRARSIRYSREHPEQGRKHVRQRRAQKRAVSENFTCKMEQFTHKFWGDQCAVCGATEKLCIDHWLPLSKGHALTMDNAVLLCKPCNCHKSARAPEDVYDQKFVKTVEQRLCKQARQWSNIPLNLHDVDNLSSDLDI